MRVLHLITARGGSKGVPDKNLKEVGGLHLIGYKAIAAKRSRHCTTLAISTDSPAIQDIARSYGVDVPFTRPEELATDTASSVDVVRHAMEHYENAGEVFDAVMLLEPTSPFATPDHLNQAVEIMQDQQATLVVGMVRQKINSVFVGEMDSRGRIASIVHNIRDLRNMNRQNLAPEYTMNGAFYLFSWGAFRDCGHIYCDPDTSYGVEMDEFYSIEIDHPVDLAWADYVVREGYVDLGAWS